MFYKKLLFLIAALVCLLGLVQTPAALLLGFLFSFVIGNPYAIITRKVTKLLLQISVVGLGFGMNIFSAIEAGKEGLLLTASTIVAVLVGGWALGRLLNTSQKVSALITSGTAICGGSAIAAVAPIIDSDENDTSIALATILVLNSVALLTFPYLGKYLSLTEQQFGYWAAIAIHDTSSVVGAAQKYGDSALHIATTVKLERTLWIIPVSLFFALTNNKKLSDNKIKIPYFILLYILAVLLNTFLPTLSHIAPPIVVGAKKMMVLTLFLIGAGLPKGIYRSIGARPFIQGFLLWLLVSVLSLWLILIFI